MRETKRRMELYSFYDRTGLERHLARMAEKGWLLDKIGQFFWHYRRIEPEKLTFSVCYFPKASQFDPEPSEEQQTFYDFCGHTGWTLAASNAQLQVFYNKRERPVPINTDPVTEVESIHRTMKRSALPSQAVLLAISLLNCALQLLQLHDDPIRLLASPATLVSCTCWLVLFVLIGVEWVSYFSWHRRAALAAQRGEYLETRSHRPLQIAALAVLAAALAYLLASAFLSGSRLMITITLLMLLLYVPAAFLLVNGIKRLMKHMKAPAGINRTVTLAGSFVLLGAVVAVITFGTLFAYNRGWMGGDGEVYEYQGRTYTLRRDRLPLTLEDLLDGDFDRYSRERQGEQSPLLGQYTMRQWPLGPVELFPEKVFLDYEITLVKAPFLYGLCRETKLHEQDHWNEYPEGQYRYEPTDPAPWGAQEAYRWMRGDIPSSQFLLLYPDRIVEISMDWEQDPTPAQMAAAGEKLGRGPV